MRKNIVKESLVFLLLFAFGLFFFCAGERITRPKKPEYEYTINGVVVKDLNLNQDLAHFTILRDSVVFDSAAVEVGLDTLESQGNGAYHMEAPELFDFGEDVFISISCDKDTFRLETSVLIPGSFYIDDLPLPDDTLNPGGLGVPVTWRASVGASGYFLSVVNPDAAPGLVGYTTLDDLNDRSENIPQDAFRAGLDLIEGRYEVYVIAYYESFVEYPEMPFELADGLPAGKLEGADGIIGAGVVAEKKYIRVVAGL